MLHLFRGYTYDPIKGEQNLRVEEKKELLKHILETPYLNKIDDDFIGWPTDTSIGGFNIKHKVNEQTEKAYTPNGAVYVFKYSLLKNKYSYIFDKTYAYIMPHERSIDIDTMLDFKFAEFLMQR